MFAASRVACQLKTEGRAVYTRGKKAAASQVDLEGETAMPVNASKEAVSLGRYVQWARSR
jgi:hypothetical protein